jgi:hypothetical protein
MDQKKTASVRLERQLARRLHTHCPRPHDLGEYQMGLLPRQQMQAVGQHVEQCPHCQLELAQLSQFLMTEEKPLLEEITTIVLEWAKGLLPRPSGLALAGMRGGAGRGRTFTAAHLWLAVVVQERMDDRRDLLALVTHQDGYPLDGGDAWLSQGLRICARGQIDGHGNVVLVAVEPGLYDLHVQTKGTRVTVCGIEL